MDGRAPYFVVFPSIEGHTFAKNGRENTRFLGFPVLRRPFFCKKWTGERLIFSISRPSHISAISDLYQLIYGLGKAVDHVVGGAPGGAESGDDVGLVQALGGLEEDPFAEFVSELVLKDEELLVRR